jgi:hypothetical protein
MRAAIWKAKFDGHLNRCRVPDDWLLHNRRGLLLGREVLRAVLARSSVRQG